MDARLERLASEIPPRLLRDGATGCPLVPLFPILGVILCVALMFSLPIETWARFVGWLAIGLVIYFAYSVRHSRLQKGIDTGDTEDILPPPIR